MLPFFKDSRYIKENNKPILVIYRPYLCPYMIDILKYWNKLAKENCFNGLYTMSQRFEDKTDRELFDYVDRHIEYEPGFVWSKTEYPENKVSLKSKIHDYILRKFNVDMALLATGPQFRDYDQVWKRILQLEPESDKSVPGAF